MGSQSASSLLDVEVEQEKLQQAFHKYAAVTGKKLGAVVKQNARLIAWNLMHNTQPYGMTLASRKLGEAAVIRDVGKVYAPASAIYQQLLEIGAAKFAKAWYKLVKSGEFQKAEDMLRKTTLTDRNASISAPLNPELHRSIRNNSGRVSRQRAAQIVPDAKEIKNYGKQRAALVGFGKAGWLTAASSLGSIARVPAWITRHKGKAPGHADDHTDRNTDPYVVLHNDVRYASKILTDGEKANALKIQTEKMLAHIEHVLVNSAKEAGFDAHATEPATAPDQS
jgi:hypothetical protein